MDESNIILDATGYSCGNQDKLNRAIFGNTSQGGALSGGVGEKATPEAKLAAYDRLAGLILTKEGHKVKTGSFWDLDKQEARKDKKVVLVFRDIEGKEVEVPEDKEIPMEVRAAEIAKNQPAKKVKRIKDEE